MMERTRILIHFSFTVKAATSIFISGRGSTISSVKDIYYCLIEIIKGLADKGQFQYLTNLKGPQEGSYLYTTLFHSLR